MNDDESQETLVLYILQIVTWIKSKCTQIHILLKDESQGADFMCCVIWNAYYVDVMPDV